MTCEQENEPAALWPEKDPSTKDYFGVDWEGRLTRWWKPGASYTLGTRIRPNRPMGYEAECTRPGQSGMREPWFPRVDGAVVETDGSVQWTLRPLSTSSLITTVASVEPWVLDAGVTVSGQTLYGQASIALIEGGADGTDYTAVITATCADGTRRTKVCILPVRRAVRICQG